MSLPFGKLHRLAIFPSSIFGVITIQLKVQIGQLWYPFLSHCIKKMAHLTFAQIMMPNNNFYMADFKKMLMGPYYDIFSSGKHLYPYFGPFNSFWAKLTPNIFLIMFFIQSEDFVRNHRKLLKLLQFLMFFQVGHFRPSFMNTSLSYWKQRVHMLFLKITGRDFHLMRRLHQMLLPIGRLFQPNFTIFRRFQRILLKTGRIIIMRMFTF